MNIRQYAKAIAALLGSVATFLVTVNAPAQWSLWIGSAVAVLTGVATFGVPNAPGNPIPTPLPPADAAITGVQQTVQNAVNATAELDRVKDAVGQILGNVPVLGPLATQVLNSLPKLP